MPVEFDILIHHLASASASPQEGEWVASFTNYLRSILRKLGIENIQISLTSGGLPTAQELNAGKAVVVIESYDTVTHEGYVDYLETILDSDLYPKKVFKVHKDPMTLDDEPEKLQRLISYELFDEESEDAFSQSFWLKTVDLAYDIYRRSFKSSLEGDTTTPNATVFLAETSRDQVKVRSMVRRELLRYGYRVVPDTTLPLEGKKREEAILSFLRESTMSIHIVGESTADEEDETRLKEMARIEMQNEVAAKYCDRENDNFQRLIWFSPELGAGGELQLLQVERMKRDAKALIGAELIQTPVEKLKNIIKGRLSDLLTGNGAGVGAVTDDRLSVYLICDIEDLEKVKEVVTLLEQKGYRVLLPGFEETEMTLLESHRKNLASCDAALIYHGHHNARWVQMKLLDLLKAPGYGRKKPMLAKGLYLRQQDLHVQPNEQLKDLTVLPSNGMINAESLSPFFQKLNRHGA